MCGIAGIVSPNPSVEKMDAMLFAQKHRGPDNTSKFVSENAVLGHNRLSIIDLSEAGNQPFYSEDNRYVLVFNGEIYNYLELKEELKTTYKFKTNSDTEVLLAAYLTWKENCFSKLNGMFSFAVWDTLNHTLFAARDRFGVKPFYFYKNNNEFFFASEIKTLFAAHVPKVINENVWANYLAYGSYGLPNETFWKGISQLPGGHFLFLKKDKLEIKKWYVFEDEIKKHQELSLDYKEVKDTYFNLLEDSIKLRFRADVPVGFNISGGVDSSALLALVNKTQSNNITGYTFYTGDNRYDELPWVEELISITKNPLCKVKLEHNEVEELTKELSYFQDEPFGGLPTIAYAKLFKQARSNGVKVLLDGQGMDEQWAGYDYYFKQNDAVVQGVSKSPFRTNVLNNNILQFANKPIYNQPFEDALLNKQYRDLFYTKIPRALRFNDRVSMASSTELREPFLDYRLVEFAFAQPKELKIKNGIQKYLLRDLVSDYLTKNITYAPKRPLQTPQREWLGGELKDFINEEIKSLITSDIANWFNVEALKKEWNGYLNGDKDSSFHIWQWISLAQIIKK